MSKYNFNQSNFSYGEVGPQFQGRKDLKEYANGLEQLENLIVQKQGGITKRPGGRYIATESNAQRIIPFIFSKNESYAIVARGYNANPFTIYKSDGTQVSLNTDALNENITLHPEYDPANWKYSQNGDILVLVYSAPITDEGRNPVSFEGINNIAPVFIIRTNTDEFVGYTYTNPIALNVVDAIPSQFKFNAAVNYPYLNSNVNPNIRLYVDSNTQSTTRLIYAVDSFNNAIPFFRPGHVFDLSSSPAKPSKTGAFFRLQKSSSELVCWGDTFYNTWQQLLNSVSNIDTGTDIVTTSASHNYTIGDVVRLSFVTTIGTTDPVISGQSTVDATYVSNTKVYENDFNVRVLTATTFTLHPTYGDAVANTNILDFTTAGDRALLVEGVRMHSMPVVIEIATGAALASAADATDDWKESAWSSYQGFPRSVANYEQRLFFGGNKRKPGTLWGSQVGNIFNMMQTRLEQDTATRSVGFAKLPFVLTGDAVVTDPIDFTIASEQANIIQWMKSFTVLTIGTLGAEYVVSGGDQIISKDSIFVKKQTEYGSNNAGPITNGNSTLYVSRDGRRVMEFKYNDTNGSYISTNLNLINEFMVYKGFDGLSTSTLKNVEFKELHYQPSREVVWLVTTNNGLVGMTYSRETQTVAWQYCPTRSGDSILSAGVIYNSETYTDELWVIAERSINGSTVQYIEKIGDDFEHPYLANTSTADSDIPIYSDSAIVITLGSSTNVVTGLTHLEGETVSILAGSTVEAQKTVSSGQITLDATYASGTKIIVGLPYTAKFKSLDINSGADFGSSDGNRQRNDRVAIRLYNSQGGDYGTPDQSTLFPIEYDDTSLFTGIKRLFIDQTAEMESKVYIEHSDPTPFNILSMTYRGVAYD